MTDREFKVYAGEDMLPEYDYTDWLIWEEAEFGGKAYNGESTLSRLPIQDVQGVTGNQADLPAGLSFRTISARNVATIRVGSTTMWRGRIGVKDYSRDGRQSDRYRLADTQAFDYNQDLKEIIVDGWARSAETDVARVQGLVADYYSGVSGQIGPVAGLNPRPTTQLNGSNSVVVGSNTVSLPAKTYTKTSADMVLQEIADTANKLYFVTVDGELFYDGNDSTAYRSPLRISDRESEVRADPWTFAPIWDLGPASTEDGMQQRAGVRLYYGPGDSDYVDSYLPSVANQYAHTAEVIYDDTIVSAAVAQRKANTYVSFRSKEERTYSCSVGPLTDAHVGSIKWGQLVSIKARAIPDADDAYVDRRIVELKWTTPVPGTWFAHMRLGRPLREQPYGTGTPPGPQPPSAGGPASCSLAPGQMTEVATPNGGFEDGDGTNWGPPAANVDPQGPDASGNPSGEGEYWDYGIGLDMWRYYAGWVGQTFKAGVTYVVRFYSDSTGTINAYFGDGSTTWPGYNETTPPAWSGSGDYVVERYPGETGVSKWRCMEWTPSADRTNVYLYIVVGDASMTTDGVQLYVGTAAELPTLGGPGEGDPGTPGSYLPPDAVIEHGDLSGKGGTMHDASQIEVTDTDGNFTGTDVETVLAELSDSISAGGAPTDVNYLVGTASGDLSAEIVVGTTPGGELGGTWASPTVDATHSGSAHHTEDHASRHASGGADAVKLDDLAAPDDNTDLNASTTKHGLLRKLSGTSTEYLDGSGAWSTPAGGGGGSLTVEESDTSPTDSAVTKIVFPKDSLAIASHEATFAPRATILAILDGGGDELPDSLQCDVTVDFACEIESVTLLADQSGSVVVDIWKDSYANFPPTDADSITASAVPTISTATKATDATLTGWTTAIAAGDVLRFNVDSATTIERVTLALKVKRT